MFEVTYCSRRRHLVIPPESRQTIWTRNQLKHIYEDAWFTGRKGGVRIRAHVAQLSCFFVALHHPFALQACNCLKSPNKTRCTVPYSSAPSVVPLRVLSAMPSCFASASKMSQSIIDRTVAAASIAKANGRSSQDRLAPVPLHVDTSSRSRRLMCSSATTFSCRFVKSNFDS